MEKQPRIGAELGGDGLCVQIYVLHLLIARQRHIGQEQSLITDTNIDMWVHSRKMDISYEAWGQISLGSS